MGKKKKRKEPGIREFCVWQYIMLYTQHAGETSSATWQDGATGLVWLTSSFRTQKTGEVGAVARDHSRQTGGIEI